MAQRSLMRRAGRWAALLVATGCAAIALAQKVDPATSSVSAVFTQMGVPVAAKFNRFEADVRFDPAAPDTAQARIEIDVASFDLGDPEYNKEVLKPEWFNAAAHPTARFVSSAIEASAPGKLMAAGTLTIKGKSQAVKVPVSYRDEAGYRVFEGELPIERLYFNIGDGEWRDTDMVADRVVIKFKIATASR
jgi:polyisoprenoid-binding protein YceI